MVEHPLGVESGGGNAIIILDIDAIPEEEGINGRAPDSTRTNSHGEENLIRIRIVKAANELISCEGAIVVCVSMTIATKLTHLALDQVFNCSGQYIVWRINT